MTSDLSQQLLRQVGRIGSVERPRLWQSGDDGASSLKQREWALMEKKRKDLKYAILMQISVTTPDVSCSPSRFSSSSSSYKPKWAPLDPPDGQQGRDTSDFLSMEKAWRQTWGITGWWMCFLTALLSSFLIVDLPHRALTPSTATARRKSDSGPLCNLSSFITAPTTSLLLFTRAIPWGREKSNQKPEYNILQTKIKSSLEGFCFSRWSSKKCDKWPQVMSL